MVTQTMTNEEILREYYLDKKNVIDVLVKRQDKADKVARKMNKFPAILHSYINTPRKNTWIVIWQYVDKKTLKGGPNVIFYLCADTDKGKVVYTTKDEMRRDDRLYVYNPHLFSRYAQRMNIDKTGLDLIVHFFKNNLYYFFYEEKSKDGIYDFRISTKEGVLFGVCDYPMVQLRTFVSNEMLFEDQSEYLTDTEEIIEFGKNNCFELQNPEYIR